MKIYTEKLKEGVILEFQVFSSEQSTYNFRLGIIRETNYSKIEDYYAYICKEDSNLYIVVVYSGGQTGAGINLEDIKKFDDVTYLNHKVELVKFL